MKILTDIRKCAIFLSLILLFIGLLSGKIYLFCGLLVGCMLSILNFHGLSTIAQKIVQFKDKKPAITFIILNYTMKLAVITVILVIAIKINLLAFVGVLTGLMTVNLSILGQAFRQQSAFPQTHID
ncbi:ATP synthase subunit I [Candidatus Desantisbacteria bacterium]|nr:ATP synthase subunit I [Candidatus Desantisbacteria bacterium]